MEAIWFFSLLTIGIVLICLEIFVPGGIIGTIGALCLVASMVLSFFAFPPAYGIPICIGVILLMGICLALFIKVFPKSPIGRLMTLSADGSDFSASQEGLPDLLNTEGVTKSDLRPAGFAIIDGKRIDVVSEGGMIEKDTKVRVIEVEGNRVVVRAMDS